MLLDNKVYSDDRIFWFDEFLAWTTPTRTVETDTRPLVTSAVFNIDNRFLSPETIHSFGYIYSRAIEYLISIYVNIEFTMVCKESHHPVLIGMRQCTVALSQSTVVRTTNFPHLRNKYSCGHKLSTKIITDDTRTSNFTECMDNHTTPFIKLRMDIKCKGRLQKKFDNVY